MYDINFFSVYKKKKGKSSGVKIFLIIFISLFVLGNILLAGGAYLYFTSMKASIAEKQAYIDSQEVKDKIAEAARIKREATLSNEYLKLLQSATNKIHQMDIVNSRLLTQIREMTPANTQYTFSEYDGILINLECVSWTITDPMDMYHTFLENPMFATVTLTGINVLADGQISFSIICQLAGGESK
ncbi:MAG TPA: hypothetical protein DD640_07135 [Clostridiales bacterium]|nr:hypothetical protein [Clostridiales bacterium]